MTAGVWANVIAGLALVVAVVGWLDSRRRIKHSAVQFSITHAENSRYLIRHMGTATAPRVYVSPESLTGYESNILPPSDLMPGASTDVYVHPDRYGKLPDEITIRYGRRGVRVVPFPAAPNDASSPSARP